MIQPASLLGFGLAFLITSWTLSAILGAGILAARAPLRRRGPRLERTVTAAGLILPAVVACTVVAVLLGHSLAATGLADDHCPAHLHHLHLCVVHGAAWGQEPWAVVTITTLGTLVVARSTHLLASQLRARRALSTLRRTGEWAGDVIRVPSPRVFCFVAGLRRAHVYVSTAAWEVLGETGRRAALAHERHHAACGDVARRLGLGLLAVVGAPFVARRLLARWSSATERLCDRAAADAVGDPVAVADALVLFARRAAAPPVTAAAFTGSAADLELRVEALLGPAPADEGVARRSWRAALVGAAAAAMMAITHADTLHHLLETLLGVF